MTILILGKDGQVGKALCQLLGNNHIALGRQDADLAKPENLYKTLASYQPSAIINAAAYTAVDKAEQEASLAERINSIAPKIIATYCKDAKIPMLHYSTDYVFAGEGSQPAIETQNTAPLSTYGRTKLAGEENITATRGDYLIFRTSWVYDDDGKNFVNTMLKIGKERELLKVVSDQIGAPTYAPDLASASLKALEYAKSQQEFPSGIYHICNEGETSWYEFARQIFTLATKYGITTMVKEIQPILTTEYKTPATRPLNSRLDCSKAQDILHITMPFWLDSLEKSLKNKAESL